MGNFANRNSHRSTVELKDNTTIVVLGASGDLAKKKTVRAYHHEHVIESPG